MMHTTLILAALAGGLALAFSSVAAVFPREFASRTIGRINRTRLRRAVSATTGVAFAGLATAIYLLPGQLLRTAGGLDAVLVLPWIATIPVLTIGMFLATGIGRVTTVSLLVIVASGLGAGVGSALQVAANEPDTATPTVAFVVALAALTAFISWANVHPQWSDPRRTEAAARPPGTSAGARAGAYVPAGRSRAVVGESRMDG